MSKDNAFLVNALERLIVALDKVQRTLDRVFPIVRIPRRDQPRDDEGVAVYYGCRAGGTGNDIMPDRITVTAVPALKPGERYVASALGVETHKDVKP
jgi:hypothetical protein